MIETNILEVLKYIIEIYTQHNSSLPSPEVDEVVMLLEQAGFKKKIIDQAFTWLQNLAYEAIPPSDIAAQSSQTATRIYTQEECTVLDPACRGFIMQLEKLGILDPINREIVIDKAMHLDQHEFSLDSLKHLIFSVIATPPTRYWMAHLLFADKAYD